MPLLIVLVLAVLFCFAPLWLQLLLAVINLVVPDPLPWLDELIMWATVIGRFLKREPKVSLPRRRK